MKKIVSATLIALMIILNCLNVKAASEKNLTFKSNKLEINKGEEIIIEISSSKLTGIEGSLNYDKSIWTLTNKTSEESFTLNEDTGKFALANLNGEESISVKITLKSKENITTEESVIKITEVVGSDKSGEGYDSLDKEITIKFKKIENNEPTIEDPTPEDPTPVTPTPEKPKPENKIPQQTNNNVANNNSSQNKIPYTGAEDLLTIIGTLGILSTIFYIAYRKNNY